MKVVNIEIMEKQLNFKTIKDKALAGAWRRGYGYFRDNYVLELQEKKIVANAKIKGSFKDSYDVKLKLLKNDIKAECNCPLDDEWCKHAVSAALKLIDNREDAEIVEQKKEFNGSYKFLFNSKAQPKNLSFKIVENASAKTVENANDILKQAIELQSKGVLQLTDEQKHELMFFQFLLKNGRYDKARGYHHVPSNLINQAMKLMVHLENLVEEKTNKPIVFEKEKMS